MDDSAVAAAVDELGRMLRADGADLVLLDANPKTARVHLRLVLDTVGCEECILAPDLLRETINDSLQRRIVGEFELVLDDPLARQVTDDSEAQLDAWSTLVAVYQSVLHDVVRALEDEAGLDSGVFSALAYLARAESPGRLRLGDLQELMHPRYSQPGLSRLVQRMEADGLVERRPDPDDGRATLLVTTRAGRARYARAGRVYTAALQEHFGRHLAVGEAHALERALEPVVRGRAIGAPASRTVPAR